MFATKGDNSGARGFNQFAQRLITHAWIALPKGAVLGLGDVKMLAAIGRNFGERQGKQQSLISQTAILTDDQYVEWFCLSFALGHCRTLAFSKIIGWGCRAAKHGCVPGLRSRVVVLGHCLQ